MSEQTMMIMYFLSILFVILCAWIAQCIKQRQDKRTKPELESMPLSLATEIRLDRDPVKRERYYQVREQECFLRGLEYDRMAMKHDKELQKRH